MQATLKSFGSLLLVLLLLGGSALIGVWRSQHRGIVGAQLLDEDDHPAAPLLVPNSPLRTDGIGFIAPVEQEVDLPRVDTLTVFAVPREQLDLADDLRRVQRAVRRAGRFSPADLTALATLLNAEQRERTPELTAAVQIIVDEFSEAARQRLPAEFLPAALQLANLLTPEAARFRNAAVLLQQIDQAREREEKLASAEAVLASVSARPARLQLALLAFREVLVSDPGNSRAIAGIEQIERRLIDRAMALVQDGDFARAAEVLDEAAAVRTQSTEVAQARAQFRASRLQREGELLNQFETALAAREVSAAATILESLRQVPIATERAQELAERLQNTQLYGGYRPAESFSDTLAQGGSGPRMRVLPVGRFRMGSPDAEAGRQKNEGPSRTLRMVRGLAMAQTEVTVADFRAFVEATQYVTDAEKLGSSAAYQERSGRIQRTRGANWRKNFRGDSAGAKAPVVHVSFNDARAYAKWLSGQTEQVYRLPTEAEFEYALRAGTSTPYWWGDGSPDEVVENLTGAQDSSRSQRRWNTAFAGYGDGHWGPAPVRSFKPNAFGLYDMAGNVSEWVEDCWHDSYVRAPENMQAWVNPGCDLRVVRGGSWGSPPVEVRSAYRIGVVAENRGARIGFRVVREL